MTNVFGGNPSFSNQLTPFYRTPKPAGFQNFDVYNPFDGASQSTKDSPIAKRTRATKATKETKEASAATSTPDPAHRVVSIPTIDDCFDSLEQVVNTKRGSEFALPKAARQHFEYISNKLKTEILHLRQLANDSINALNDNGSNSCNQTEKSEDLTHITNVLEQLQEQIKENSKLIKEIKQNSATKTNETAPQSYAEACNKGSKAQLPIPKPPTKLSVKIPPNSNKSAVLNSLSALKTSARIDKINVTPKEISINCQTESDKTTLLAELNDNDFKVVIPKQRRQNVIITNVPSYVDKVSLFEKIHQTLRTNQSNFPIRLFKVKKHRTNPNLQHWVVSVTKISASLLCRQQFLYFGLSRSNISKFNNITRCSNCQTLTHRVSECKSKPICMNCACDHHTQNCKNQEEAKCYNCQYMNKWNAGYDGWYPLNVEHKANDRYCPTYINLKYGYWPDY